MSGFQLKIVQEVITLIVFSVFAIVVLKEPFELHYMVSFVFLIAAVYFMFKEVDLLPPETEYTVPAPRYIWALNRFFR